MHMYTGVHTYKYTWYMQTCTHTQWGEGRQEEKEVEKKQKREEERMERREEWGEEKEKTRSSFH